MVITTIKRSYSKTINTRHYAYTKESWIKLEMEAEAEVERNENEFEVSKHLGLFVKDEVNKDLKEIIKSIQDSSSLSYASTAPPLKEVQVNPPKL